ncbi:MAG: restriction endonuclease subunit R [Candidatus Bipolaricaulia bacterium]
MAKIPKKVSERLGKSTRTFQRILKAAKDRDINESDTVTIVADMLERVFGYDKYAEITSEQAIRGTYCDLAVRLNDSVKYLIEVKAVGLDLKESHLRQAIGYGANHGVPWIVLTNGIEWEVHRLAFEKPIRCELVFRFDFLSMSPRKAEHQELLFLLSKEGLATAAIEEFHEHVQVVNRFVIAAVIHCDPVLNVIRRELRRIAPGAKVSASEIRELLPEVLKRDVVEGEAAAKAQKQVSKAANAALRKRRSKSKPSQVQAETRPHNTQPPPRDERINSPSTEVRDESTEGGASREQDML